MLLRHWESDSTLARSFQALYEAFQMEVGVSGNILTHSYSDLSHLATHSWFKVLWQYCSTYDVGVFFHQRFHIPPTRDRDLSLIELFQDHRNSGRVLSILNRVRKYYRVHSLADILCADGMTVDLASFSRRPRPSFRSFSWERPTPSDFELWERTIRSFMSPSLQSPRSLGPYLSPPHIPYSWFCSEDGNHLYHAFSNNGYDVFRRCYASITTRSGPRFNKISTLPGKPPTAKYASVSLYSSNHVNLHSTIPSYNRNTNTSSFMTSLLSISSDSLWSDLHVDGDGSWLIHSINNEYLDICNDGSYMPDLSRTACSGAFILRCRDSGREIRGCFTDNSIASDN